MPVVVTGSIATDHLMTFPGKFVEQSQGRPAVSWPAYLDSRAPVSRPG